MGPIALFDKSFLQSLNIDESVWFGHFFSPVICPLFYVETLADLDKAVRAGRTPEQEVGTIAAKFPDLSGYPCVHHGTLIVQELLGKPVAMGGRVPVAGGRPVMVDGKPGVVYDESPEAEAFGRWQRGAFMEIERDIAKEWRGALRELDLRAIAQALRDIGVDATTCRSLQDAYQLAQLAITRAENPFARLATVFFFLPIPLSVRTAITQRWATAGFPPIADYAPYAAHVLSIELFFHFALAAHQIGADRVSNRVDITYLHYLPFSMIFVSGDDLHRRCAPLFLKQEQEFVWAPDLKADLGRINQHFMGMPETVKAAGIMAFAKAPPKHHDSIVVRLREKFLRRGYDEEMRTRASPPANDEKASKLASELKKWTDAPRGDPNALPVNEADLQMVSLQRYVRKKKGSWFQVPKDLKEDDV